MNCQNFHKFELFREYSVETFLQESGYRRLEEATEEEREAINDVSLVIIYCTKYCYERERCKDKEKII